MSSIEYADMFLKVQESNNALYHMFSFDIKDSKKMPPTKRLLAQYDLFTLGDLIYEELLKLEKRFNRKILLEKGELNNTVGLMKDNPFVFGDALVVTIYKDSLTRDQMYTLFNEFKDSMGIDYDFNISDALYETNDYGEGAHKLYRGYCAQLLMELHKDKYKDVKKKLRKIKR
jgi:hypothetical protein